MKRTVSLGLLLGALMGTLSVVALAPVSAGETSVTQYFETTFSANGQQIWIEGWVHLTVVAPGRSFAPSDPYRVHTNLVNVRAVNRSTQQTYVGVGAASFDGVVGIPFSPIGTFRFVATRPQPPNSAKVLNMGLQFNDLLVSDDGSVTFSRVTIQNVVTPDG